MTDLATVRRTNLEALVSARGLTSVANRLKRSPSQIRDTISARKSFGEKAARSMEKEWDSALPTGWLDIPGSVNERGEVVLAIPAGAAEPRPVYTTNRDEPREGYTRIPVLEAKPAAGAGGEPVDFPVVTDYLEVMEGWARQYFGPRLTSIRIVPVGGDSMSPTLNDGDLAFVDTSVNTYSQDGIYVLVFDDRLLIKRLRANLASRLLEICSDNTAYPPQVVHPQEMDRLHVMGAVRAWWAFRGN